MDFQTTARQLKAFAPDTLTLNGRSYRRSPIFLTDSSAGTVRTDYNGRKRPGAIVADKIGVTVSYDRGLDLYNVVVATVDGMTLEQGVLAEHTGVYAEDFERLQEFCRR